MGINRDSITRSGSHAASRTGESAIGAASNDSVNRATIQQAIRQMQATGGAVTLNLSRFGQDTVHQGGRDPGDPAITIKPGDDSGVVTDQIANALTGMGADRAEKSLVTATLKASAAAMAGQDRHGQHSSMVIRIARAGGLATYAK